MSDQLDVAAVGPQAGADVPLQDFASIAGTCRSSRVAVSVMVRRTPIETQYQ